MFDTVICVDWSAAAKPKARPAPDSIWAGVAREGAIETEHLGSRANAEAWLAALIEAERARGRRVLAGFDFALGYPEGFARAVTGSDDPLALWGWLEARVADGAPRPNHLHVAAGMNALFEGVGPFWGNGTREEIDGLPRKGTERTLARFAEKRRTEGGTRGSQPVWKLSGNGSVGSQSLTGIPVLERLRRRLRAAVWPFEPARDVTIAEIFPTLVDGPVRALCARNGAIRDEVQVALTAGALLDWLRAEPDALGDRPGGEEGWILGSGRSDILSEMAGAAAARWRPKAAEPMPVAPRLSNDCFALPQGTEWTPVDDALGKLRGLTPVTHPRAVPLEEALGRVLARDARAARANPPAANAAVDGWGFAHDGGSAWTLPVAEGRAAAGEPFPGRVPGGHAVRILTGALVPDGVDTVALQEDAAVGAGHVSIAGPLRPGSNTRREGEDFGAGDLLLPEGRRLAPQDLATLAAAGLASVAVRERLRVGVLSTGDELAAPGSTADPARTYDANRPMLLGLLRRWGHEAVDLGHAPDDRGALRAVLDRAGCHALLTSGGASGGDEDHVGALLEAEGRLETWRIAVKPGRPLALGLWKGAPLFGLPGNPVAAFVCALIFARPALERLSGAHWPEPLAIEAPAAFAKRKKDGRREFPRARLREGRVELYASEGSGRVSGLSWADGLVDLPHGAAEIREGDPVRFLPFAGFGL